MKYSELIMILLEHGCEFHHHATRHDIWVNPHGKKFPVPRHGAKEVSTQTLNQILKQAGIK
ncbi:MAG: type II toxin-antitoxin system HicA family toxin [Selenomonadaceae bacterium]|nr:type II toxin-antitoxin system HicA family toxin [Selenomonadaceae bacterium]MBQ9496432.1 type II toxin-antitoxin system HicA family toxin [Selenomonadaceae bacterium]